MGDERIDVFNPWDNSLVGAVAAVGAAQVEEVIEGTLKAGPPLTRYDRSTVLNKARVLLEARKEEFARLITAEAGLCLRESRYEVGRANDVLAFSAMEALRDDGQIFSCDISPTGKARKIFTTREPLRLVARDHALQPSAQPGRPQARARDRRRGRR